MQTSMCMRVLQCACPFAIIVQVQTHVCSRTCMWAPAHVCLNALLCACAATYSCDGVQTFSHRRSPFTEAVHMHVLPSTCLRVHTHTCVCKKARSSVPPAQKYVCRCAHPFAGKHARIDFEPRPAPCGHA